jgi:hypothetical protein
MRMPEETFECMSDEMRSSSAGELMPLLRSRL